MFLDISEGQPSLVGDVIGTKLKDSAYCDLIHVTLALGCCIRNKHRNATDSFHLRSHDE